MPKVYFTERALSDLERIFQFLEQEAPDFAIATGEEIVDATSVLQHHPLIGRPAPHNLRELVISKGHSGYVALYRFQPSRDRIDILAIRHQRECGFIDWPHHHIFVDSTRRTPIQSVRLAHQPHRMHGASSTICPKKRIT